MILLTGPDRPCMLGVAMETDTAERQYQLTCECEPSCAISGKFTHRLALLLT
jgi:hypothetical protein